MNTKEIDFFFFHSYAHTLVVSDLTLSHNKQNRPSIYFDQSNEAREAEAYCLSKAIKWTDSIQLKDVTFETDAKNVAEAFLKPKPDYTEFVS